VEIYVSLTEPSGYLSNVGTTLALRSGLHFADFNKKAAENYTCMRAKLICPHRKISLPSPILASDFRLKIRTLLSRLQTLADTSLRTTAYAFTDWAYTVLHILSDRMIVSHRRRPFDRVSYA